MAGFVFTFRLLYPRQYFCMISILLFRSSISLFHCSKAMSAQHSLQPPQRSCHSVFIFFSSVEILPCLPRQILCMRLVAEFSYHMSHFSPSLSYHASLRTLNPRQYACMIIAEIYIKNSFVGLRQKEELSGKTLPLGVRTSSLKSEYICTLCTP